jgi:hypothetical protein
MGTYKERLDRGKNDAKVVDDCCSICGAKLSQDKSMTGYYARKEHFISHGLTNEEAQYSSLKKIGTSVDKSAMGAFAESIKESEKDEHTRRD